MKPRLTHFSKFLIIVLTTVTIGVIANFIKDIGGFEKNIRSNIDENKNFIGEKILLNKDTFLIIDYSIINSNYTLDDGKTINIELAKKLKIDKK